MMIKQNQEFKSGDIAKSLITIYGDDFTIHNGDILIVLKINKGFDKGFEIQTYSFREKGIRWFFKQELLLVSERLIENTPM